MKKRLVSQSKRRSKLKVYSMVFAVFGIASICYLYFFMPKKPQSTNPPQPVISEGEKSLQCGATLPLDFLIGQMLMVGLHADTLSEHIPLFQQHQIGGVIIMTAPEDFNDNSINQFKQAASNYNIPILVATDEEGGVVQRFRGLGVLPAPAEMAKDADPAQAQEIIGLHGQKLKSIGIDMVFGPVADVAPVGHPSVLGSRVFSSDPKVVGTYSLSYVHGWQQAGLIPTIKHFPGLGSASNNTDYEPATVPSLDILKQRDFIPYQGDMADSGTAVMVGHQNVPGWFTGPASMSKEVDQYLRDDLGYHDNLIVVDSLSALAIAETMPLSEAVERSVIAGNDLLLYVATANLDQNTAAVKQMTTSLQQAVEKGTITKEQLVTSVWRKFSAQHLSLCSLQKK